MTIAAQASIGSADSPKRASTTMAGSSTSAPPGRLGARRTVSSMPTITANVSSAYIGSLDGAVPGSANKAAATTLTASV